MFNFWNTTNLQKDTKIICIHHKSVFYCLILKDNLFFEMKLSEKNQCHFLIFIHEIIVFKGNEIRDHHLISGVDGWVLLCLGLALFLTASIAVKNYVFCCHCHFAQSSSKWFKIPLYNCSNILAQIHKWSKS